jgi:hypothetical protein
METVIEAERPSPIGSLPSERSSFPSFGDATPEHRIGRFDGNLPAELFDTSFPKGKAEAKTGALEAELPVAGSLIQIRRGIEKELVTDRSPSGDLQEARTTGPESDSPLFSPQHATDEEVPLTARTE